MNKSNCKPLEGIRLIRMLRGFTQCSLAAYTKVDQAYVSRYENGLPVPEGVRQKLDAALGIRKQD